MNTTLGQSQTVMYKSGTFDGVTIATHLFAKAVNTQILASDLRPEQIQVKVTLRREGKSINIMNDNLLVLGLFNSMKNGLHYFVNGWDIKYPAAAEKALKQRTVVLKFGGCIRVGHGDELIIEVSPSSQCFNEANIDTTLSFIEFNANSAIGYEMCIPSTHSEVVQANTNSDEFSLGDNITKIAFLNFDKDNIKDQVISSLTLSSDRLDKQMTFGRILSHIADDLTNDTAKRYGAVPPAQSVFRLLDMYPQSFMLFDGEIIGNELDNARLNFTFNGNNVAVSQNYVVWRSYESTKQQVAEALQREDKHVAEKIQKL